MFQKTDMHKKLIEHFKYTVAALGDKGLPPEFDCTEFDENSEDYFNAVVQSYKGVLVQADSSDNTGESD